MRVNNECHSYGRNIEIRRETYHEKLGRDAAHKTVELLPYINGLLTLPGRAVPQWTGSLMDGEMTLQSRIGIGSILTVTPPLYRDASGMI
jgi:hypothetical protein